MELEEAALGFLKRFILMTLAVKKISVHPYVTKKKGVCGGRSVVRGTRIPVWSLIQWYKQGMTIEELTREFPHP